ncbi:hypothetical protein KR026_000555 [Drosophila bipectinata]|nr:hypothetical protein KR026_000555 [Drosophila bipectinata]
MMETYTAKDLRQCSAPFPKYDFRVKNEPIDDELSEQELCMELSIEADSIVKKEEDEEKETNKRRKWKEKYISRKESFLFREDKLKLISAVRAKPIIWDLNHKGHFNATSLNTAWQAVAAVLRKDVKDCKSTWKSLRASQRYHQKISRKKKPSGSAGGSVVPGSKANDDYDWDFASEMAFLPDLFDRRRTKTLPKPPEASTSSEISEDPELIFAEYLDESQPSSSFDQSLLEEEELQLQKGIEDMEKESSSSYSYKPQKGIEDMEKESSSSCSYKPSTKKHKTAAAESCVLTQKFTEYVDLQKAIISQTTNVPSLVTYWAEIMKELPQELKDEAEERVTKLLWDLRKRAKDYE